MRQIEIGLAAISSLVFGTTAILYSGAIAASGKFPKWLAVLGILGGGLDFAAGIGIAHTGFSDMPMTINLMGSVLLLAWLVAWGIRTWREKA